LYVVRELKFGLILHHCLFAETVLTFLNFRPTVCTQRSIVRAVPRCASARKSRA
jgi:hypothetical protein